MARLALEGWDTFAEAAALNLQRGLLPQSRSLLAPFLAPVNWFKFKQLERRQREFVAKNPVIREARERQRRASEQN